MMSNSNFKDFDGVSVIYSDGWRRHNGLADFRTYFF
jgi:hypothetical protein